jgi:glycosyltransferase involved in cell wall biosynthesis
VTEPTPILYVHHRPELGGAPTSLFYLIRHLDRERFEPHVYCPSGAVTDLFRDAGAIVHEGPASGFTHIWASTYAGRRWLLFGRDAAQLPEHIFRFRKTLGERPFRLVHLNDSPLLAAGWLAHRARIPVVWHLRSALPGDGRDRRSRMMRRAIRRFGTTSIAINQDVARVFDVGSLVVPNSVDLQRFQPGDSIEAKRQVGVDETRATVAYFGFIYPSKGFEDFIRAAALHKSRGGNAQYLIVGGPVRGAEFFSTRVGRMLEWLDLVEDYDRRAKRLVAKLGLEADVRFIPFTPNPGLLYQASDVVVAPSRGPELGRPVLEAAAAGRAIVASGSAQGAGLILPDETGYLIPRRSPDVLSAVLERLIGDDELRERLGANARRHAEANFDAEINARRVSELYDRILAA